MLKLKLTELQWNRVKIALAILYPVLALIGGLQQYFRGEKEVLGKIYTNYNNYLIFKTGAIRFWEGLNPFVGDTSIHFDTLKYSPPFCLWMNLIAWMPNLAGIITWNLLNGIVLALGLWYIPLKNEKLRIGLLAFCAIEALTSFQNLQSNALIVGAVLLGFVLAERKNWVWAPFFILFAASIKIFALGACLVFLFYNNRWKLILSSAIWFGIFVLSPIIVTGFQEFARIYSWWFTALQEDYSHSLGMSVMNMFKSIGVNISKSIFQITAILLILTSATYYPLWKNYSYRIAILSSTLMFMVAFNQRAESSTFVIAVVGAALYLLSKPMHWKNGFLLFFVMYLTTISATDLFPRTWRYNFTDVYGLKVLPIFTVWVLLQWDLIKQVVMKRFD